MSTETIQYDVVIAGAGPVGLFLACELRLAEISVLVLERDVVPDSEWKSFPMGLRGLNTSSVEALYRRGLLDKIQMDELGPQQSNPGKPKMAGHFAGIMFDGSKLDMTRFKYTLKGPALNPCLIMTGQLEDALIERATILGVTILRGNGVSSVSQNCDGVTVGTDSGESYRGRWVVGCDGGRSAVRKAVGIDLVGTKATATGYSTKCEFEPGTMTLPPGSNNTGNGMFFTGFGGDSGMLQLLDFGSVDYDRSQPVTREHLQGVLNRVIGHDQVKIKKVLFASTWTDRAMQATKYRKDRVILAGDAAHIHAPMGGQGLNLGLGDAMNLGWKLATTIKMERGIVHIPDEHNKLNLALLDSYQAERYPAGEAVIQWARAQLATLLPGGCGKAVREVLSDLLGTVDGVNMAIGRSWGLSMRYQLPGCADDMHELVGRSVPDFKLHDGSRLGNKQTDGRGLFIDFTGSTQLKELVNNSNAKNVLYVAMDAEDTCDLGAVLVRPDGVVAWTMDQDAKPNLHAIVLALKSWFET
ncbi:hypothetical protein MY3957_009763 [Beauveria namnaoensis]